MWQKFINWFKVFDLNKDDRVTAEDLEFAKAIADKNLKEANQLINEAKVSAKRVKEELVDVGKSVKEVLNQADDIIDAAKGKKRRGRKSKQ
jgi:hypothetical protein